MTDLADSADLTDSVDSTDSADLADSADSADSTDSADSADLADSTDSADSAEFDGYSMLSLKGYFVSFSLLLKVLYLLVSYSLSYTWLKREPQISIRKERFILPLLIYFKLTKLQKFLQK